MSTPSMPVPGSIEGALDNAPLARPRGSYLELIHSWVVTVDHKRIGILYIVYALFFLIVAGIEAMIIRIQLAIPHNTFVSPYVYNRIFTMHGTTMVFLMGMPILFGFGNYLLPLMLGARDMAFPRLNAFSFWVSAFAGMLLYFSFIGGSGLVGTGTAPDVAWFAYAPLTEKPFSPGHTVDYWAVGLLVNGIGSIGTRDQHPRHYLLHALQRYDVVTHSATGLDLCHGSLSCSCCRQPSYGGSGHAADRPLPWRPLL